MAVVKEVELDHDQWDLFLQAIRTVHRKIDPEMTPDEALEVICIDFVESFDGETVERR